MDGMFRSLYATIATLPDLLYRLRSRYHVYLEYRRMKWIGKTKAAEKESLERLSILSVEY